MNQFLLAVFFPLLFVFGQRHYTDLVNPFVGTDGHGHTFPGATAPFGMVQLSPDTRVEGWDACSGYHYSDSTIMGFSHTHLSGTGIGDYGDILFMPTVGTIQLTSGRESDPRTGYRSTFRHKNENASPGYYSVLLDDDSISVELTATTRVGIHRYTFPETDSAHVIIDLVHGIGPDVVIDSWITSNRTNEISGYRRSRGWANDQRIYFVAQFSQPMKRFGIAMNDGVMWDSDSASGTSVKAVVEFDTKSNKEIVVKVALSSVSAEGAKKNLQQEAADRTFDDIREQTEHQWNKELSKIEIFGGTRSQQRTFYTALYHCFIAPNTFSDVDGRYRGSDGNIHTANDHTMYTVFSLWDTFRALHPLFTIIEQKRTVDFIKTFLAQYEHGGLLPVWELAANETWCMIGYHSVSVITDAYVKGIDSFDAETALTAMTKSATQDHFGLKYFPEYGYIPADKESESVSKTLEYSYDDWCIARMAQSMKRDDVARTYFYRSQFYQNLFDPKSGFMRSRRNGMWSEPFSPYAVTNDYTEANSWQYSFFVPHDIGGLMELHGGKKKFIKKLDELFSVTWVLEGRNQSDITGLIGQYAHGNEPSHHMAYLYAYAGESWKTQERVNQIMNELYDDTPDGLSGNEDCGQMSAWYILSALGFYQVTPGNPEYIFGSPLFDSAKIHLENGKTVSLIAKNNSMSNKYVRSVTVNNSTVSRNSCTHAELMSGATIRFDKQSVPEKSFNSLPLVIPGMKSNMKFLPSPVFSALGSSFADSIVFEIRSLTPQTPVFYTLDGSLPTNNSIRYLEPITIYNNTVVKAIAVKKGFPNSHVSEASFKKTAVAGEIVLHSQFSPLYTAGGAVGLIDGIYGVEDFRVGHWQGYEQTDLEATIDLHMIKDIHEIGVTFLQDNNAWIFFPTGIEILISTNGKDFLTYFSETTGILPETPGAVINRISHKANAKARYIKIHAKNIGYCPQWHKGNGNKAWLFVDEIEIQ